MDLALQMEESRQRRVRAVPPVKEQSSLSIFRTLITAYHILQYHGILDGFGHLTVRNPQNDGEFFMAGGTFSPAMSRAEHLGHFTVEGAVPIGGNTSTSPWSERWIHACIYRRNPHIKSVIHSHSRALVAFGISGVPLRAGFHVASFLGIHDSCGGGVPIFDPVESGLYESGEAKNLLINSSKLGEALASALDPKCPVILQRGHGFTAVGSSIEQTVYRAVETQDMADIQTRMIQLNGGVITSSRFFTREEAQDCTEMIEASEKKAWAYWKSLVDADPRYKNELER